MVEDDLFFKYMESLQSSISVPHVVVNRITAATTKFKKIVLIILI